MAVGSSVRVGGPIHRYEVPVDDQVHDLECGEPLFVGLRRADVVEFWADSDATVRRHLTVIGTGHVLPAATCFYWGTVVDGPYVWHLVEVT